MSSPVVADPAVLKFVESVAAGANAAADSVAGLVLRLVGRVGALEKTVKEQATKIEKIGKLAQAKSAPIAQLAPTMTGVDVETGAPVRIMPRRPRGRPIGSRDTHKRPSRRRHNLQAEVSNNLIDDDWDHLGTG
jgi:hypothetical protein